MKIEKIHAIYFSPTGTTRKVVTCLAENIRTLLPDISLEIHDFTLPSGRVKAPDIHSSELAIAGLPVYAGRLPNLLLKYLATWTGNGALAVPVVLYGNRSYDNALIELRDILENEGFHTIAAAAFVGQHSFSLKLATARPDEEDFNVIKQFAAEIIRRVADLKNEIPLKIEVPGQGLPDYGGYYKPKGIDGEIVNILKVKPKTTDACIACKLCAEICPMGAIDFANPATVPGICIKCNACVKACPVVAKQLVDEAYLSHVRFLEENYTQRAKMELF